MKKEKRDMQDRKEIIGFFFYLTLVILILHEVYLPRIGIGGIFDELLDVLVLLIFCGFCIKMLIKEKTRVKKVFACIAFCVCLCVAVYLGAVITADIKDGPVTDTFTQIETRSSQGVRFIYYYLYGIGDECSSKEFPVRSSQYWDYQDAGPLQITYYPRMNRIWKIEEIK